MQENNTNTSKIKALEESGAWQGHQATWWAQPTLGIALCGPPVPPHQSIGVAKKHTLNLISPLVASRCKIEDSKEAIDGL